MKLKQLGLYFLINIILLFCIYKYQFSNSIISKIHEWQFSFFTISATNTNAQNDEAQNSPTKILLVENFAEKNNYANSDFADFEENIISYPYQTQDVALLLKAVKNLSPKAIAFLPIFSPDFFRAENNLAKESLLNELATVADKTIFALELSNNPLHEHENLNAQQQSLLSASSCEIIQKLTTQNTPNFTTINQATKINLSTPHAFTHIDLGREISTAYQSFSIPAIAHKRSDKKTNKNSIYISLPFLTSRISNNYQKTEVSINLEKRQLDFGKKLKFQLDKNFSLNLPYILLSKVNKVSVEEFLNIFQEIANDPSPSNPTFTKHKNAIIIFANNDKFTLKYQQPNIIDKITNNENYPDNTPQKFLTENELIAASCVATTMNLACRRLPFVAEIMLALATIIIIAIKFCGKLPLNFPSKHNQKIRTNKNTSAIFGIFLSFTICFLLFLGLQIWLPFTIIGTPFFTLFFISSNHQTATRVMPPVYLPSNK